MTSSSQTNKESLEKIISNSIQLVDKLNLNNFKYKNSKVLTCRNEIIKAYKLRTLAYSSNPNLKKSLTENQFGLTYDIYDNHSINFGTYDKGELIGTNRLIINSEIGIPSQKFLSKENNLYVNQNNIPELSKLAVKHNSKNAWKETVKILLLACEKLDFEQALMTVSTRHAKTLYRNCNLETIQEFDAFGEITQPSISALWNKTDYIKF